MRKGPLPLLLLIVAAFYNVTLALEPHASPVVAMVSHEGSLAFCSPQAPYLSYEPWPAASQLLDASCFALASRDSLLWLGGAFQGRFLALDSQMRRVAPLEGDDSSSLGGHVLALLPLEGGALLSGIFMPMRPNVLFFNLSSRALERHAPDDLHPLTSLAATSLYVYGVSLEDRAVYRRELAFPTQPWELASGVQGAHVVQAEAGGVLVGGSFTFPYASVFFLRDDGVAGALAAGLPTPVTALGRSGSSVLAASDGALFVYTGAAWHLAFEAGGRIEAIEGEFGVVGGEFPGFVAPFEPPAPPGCSSWEQLGTFDREVLAMHAEDSGIYVCGRFFGLVAHFSLPEGYVTSPLALPFSEGGKCMAVHAWGDMLFIGGDFSSKRVTNFAAVSRSSGELVSSGGVRGNVATVNAGPSGTYLGGEFEDHVVRWTGGDSFVPVGQPALEQDVNVVLAVGDYLYAGHAQVSRIPLAGLASSAWELLPGLELQAGTVRALAVIPGSGVLLIGGTFALPQPGVVAYDADISAPLVDLFPGTHSGVLALHASSEYGVLAAGSSSPLKGRPFVHHFVNSVWNEVASPLNNVRSLATVGGNLYVAGEFSDVASNLEGNHAHFVRACFAQLERVPIAPAHQVSAEPTLTPSASPTLQPSLSPTRAPSAAPSVAVTARTIPPTASPSSSPTSAAPTATPTSSTPTDGPTAAPPLISTITTTTTAFSTAPSPTQTPTTSLPEGFCCCYPAGTMNCIAIPKLVCLASGRCEPWTLSPTTALPTAAPSAQPSAAPTSLAPTSPAPTSPAPTSPAPTVLPTGSPSAQPSAAPTIEIPDVPRCCCFPNGSTFSSSCTDLVPIDLCELGLGSCTRPQPIVTTLWPTASPTPAPSAFPTTSAPTSPSPTTTSPTTPLPTSLAPSTRFPTTRFPTTMSPSMSPTSSSPTTRSPTTRLPTTARPTRSPSTLFPTRSPTSRAPTTTPPPTTPFPTLATTTTLATSRDTDTATGSTQQSPDRCCCYWQGSAQCTPNVQRFSCLLIGGICGCCCSSLPTGGCDVSPSACAAASGACVAPSTPSSPPRTSAVVVTTTTTSTDTTRTQTTRAPTTLAPTTLAPTTLAPTTPVPPAMVRVVVFIDVNGDGERGLEEPLASSLRIWVDQTDVVETDSDGGFSMEASRVSSSSLGRMEPDGELTTGQGVPDDLLVGWAFYSTIRVRVLEDDGSPAAGRGASCVMGTSSLSTITGEDGVAELTGLLPGEWSVEVNGFRRALWTADGTGVTWETDEEWYGALVKGDLVVDGPSEMRRLTLDQGATLSMLYTGERIQVQRVHASNATLIMGAGTDVYIQEGLQMQFARVVLGAESRMELEQDTTLSMASTLELEEGAKVVSRGSLDASSGSTVRVGALSGLQVDQVARLRSGSTLDVTEGGTLSFNSLEAEDGAIIYARAALLDSECQRTLSLGQVGNTTGNVTVTSAYETTTLEAEGNLTVVIHDGCYLETSSISTWVIAVCAAMGAALVAAIVLLAVLLYRRKLAAAALHHDMDVEMSRAAAAMEPQKAATEPVAAKAPPSAPVLAKEPTPAVLALRATADEPTEYMTVSESEGRFDVSVDDPPQHDPPLLESLLPDTDPEADTVGDEEESSAYTYTSGSVSASMHEEESREHISFHWTSTEYEPGSSPSVSAAEWQ